MTTIVSIREISPDSAKGTMMFSTGLGPEGKRGLRGLQGLRGKQGLQGLKGDDGTCGTSFVFSSPNPSSLWEIEHNLGFRPSITIFDAQGNECFGDIEHNTLNKTTVSFSADIAGSARLT